MSNCLFLFYFLLVRECSEAKLEKVMNKISDTIDMYGKLTDFSLVILDLLLEELTHMERDTKYVWYFWLLEKKFNFFS